MNQEKLSNSYRLCSNSKYGPKGLLINHWELIDKIPYFDRPMFEKIGPDDEYKFKVETIQRSNNMPATYLLENESELDEIMKRIIEREGTKFQKDYERIKRGFLKNETLSIALYWPSYIVNIFSYSI